MDHLHQDQNRGQFKPNPIGNGHSTPEPEQLKPYSSENLQQKQFSQKPWLKRTKQRFVELFHDSRDKVTDTQHAIKDYSNTAIEKFTARPMPYLLATSAIGFLLSSMLHRKENKKDYFYHESMKDRLMKNLPHMPIGQKPLFSRVKDQFNDYFHQESMKDRLMKNLPHMPFRQKPLFSRVKDQFNDLFYDSRDKISETQDTLRDYSDTAMQKVSEKPFPFLLMTTGLGFLLSSLFQQKKIKVVHLYQEQDHNPMKQNKMENNYNAPHQEHTGQHSIENLSNMQFSRRPMPYLLIAGTVGFLLSSVFYRK
ncbi:Bacterial protein of uncharacterised function (DUF883) [Legionella busanensis]|uniref:Bacterial protein of uncharacterized function (DUF883) n=1 Tax=Legionella busanensis TaxID=190655 RepID=A0A378JJX3_9GAMM|nr:hypothetical protein [Legionella busanensis]STX50988.1 Bacterial protein of uncharacterised function (DUF883) [Legionella busanensis]